MKKDALLKYLKLTRATAVRASGFLALAKDGCIGCSALPDNIEPALSDIIAVVDRENELIELLEAK